MMFDISKALALYLLSLVTLVSASPLLRRLATPDNDPFYTPQSGWQSRANGDILATRQTVLALAGLVPTASFTSYQILYKTTDQDDQPIATVTTIMVPALAARDKFLAFGVAEDAASTTCAPSYQFRLGNNQVDGLLAFEFGVIQAALLQVSAADYQGPESAFISGRLQGRAVLDSIRATSKFSTLRLKAGHTVAMWGYSGGASAIGWAAALQPTYAPEINLVGVAQGGTPANLTATAALLDGGIFSGFVPNSFHGLGAGYPVLEARFDDLFTPAAMAIISDVRTKCAAEVLLQYANINFLSNPTYTNFYALTDSVIRPVLDSLNLGSTGAAETPRVPLFVYHSGNDQIIPYGAAVTMVNNYCANGGNVQFMTYTDSAIGHFLTEVLNIPRNIAFLRDRFEGKPFAPGCSNQQNGITTGVEAIADAISLGSPALAPLLTVLVGLAKSLPAI